MPNDIDSFRKIVGTLNAQTYHNEYTKAIDSRDNIALEKCMIVKCLDEIINSNFVEVLHNGTVLFRARKINAHDDLIGKGIAFDGNKFIGFDNNNSKEAPIWISPSQRCSPEGMSIFYAAKDEYTACAEVGGVMKGSIISVAKFILKNDLRVINLKDDKNICAVAEKLGIDNPAEISRTITRIMFLFAIPISQQNEYSYSQYVADYIRKAGFDGIIYSSSKTSEYNVAIFNCHKKNLEFVSSDIKYAHYPQFQFYDLNSGEIIKPQYSEIAELTPEELSKIKNKLKNSL